ncbi:uncharacterized protein LOC100373527 [Saccoglossus kowalevskii]
MAADREFTHSSTLFTNESGQPMKFYMRPCETKANLRPLVEHGGGIITSKLDQNCIKIADAKDSIRSDNYINATYINDCVQQNRLISTDKYKLKFKASSPTPSLSDSVCSVGRSKYNSVEDDKILKYLALHRYECLGGNQIWKKMEMLKITDHSWQSMKDHFRRILKPRLQTYIKKHEQAKKNQVDKNSKPKSPIKSILKKTPPTDTSEISISEFNSSQDISDVSSFDAELYDAANIQQKQDSMEKNRKNRESLKQSPQGSVPKSPVQRRKSPRKHLLSSGNEELQSSANGLFMASTPRKNKNVKKLHTKLNTSHDDQLKERIQESGDDDDEDSEPEMRTTRSKTFNKKKVGRNKKSGTDETDAGGSDVTGTPAKKTLALQQNSDEEIVHVEKPGSWVEPLETTSADDGWDTENSEPVRRVLRRRREAFHSSESNEEERKKRKTREHRQVVEDARRLRSKKRREGDQPGTLEAGPSRERRSSLSSPPMSPRANHKLRQFVMEDMDQEFVLSQTMENDESRMKQIYDQVKRLIYDYDVSMTTAVSALYQCSGHFKTVRQLLKTAKCSRGTGTMSWCKADERKLQSSRAEDLKTLSAKYSPTVITRHMQFLEDLSSSDSD